MLPVKRLTRWRDNRDIRRVLSHAVRACDMLLNMRVTAKQRQHNRNDFPKAKYGFEKLSFGGSLFLCGLFVLRNESFTSYHLLLCNTYL